MGNLMVLLCRLLHASLGFCLSFIPITKDKGLGVTQTAHPSI